jgi:hypothetical protein
MDLPRDAKTGDADAEQLDKPGVQKVRLTRVSAGAHSFSGEALSQRGSHQS